MLLNLEHDAETKPWVTHRSHCDSIIIIIIIWTLVYSGMTKCLVQSGWTHIHPHTPTLGAPKWPICEHVWPATVDQCKFVRQWSMQESPVRAEARCYPRLPLHLAGKCVSVRACGYVCRRGGAWKEGQATVNLKQVPRKSGWLWSWLDIVAKLFNHNVTWSEEAQKDLTMLERAEKQFSVS